MSRRYVSGVSGAESPPCLSVAGDDHVPSAADFSPQERFAGSPDDLQRQILKVEQQIKAFSAFKKSVRSGMGRHSLSVGDHFSRRGLLQRPMADTDFTLPKLSGQPISVNVDRSASFGPTVVDDFDYNPHTKGSAGEFVTLRRHRQRRHPVGNPEAASVVATPPVVPPKSEGDRKVYPTIKLPTFDGKLSLESFLAKLQNCSHYYNWTDREKICHLKAALEGPAAQILWQVKGNATEKQIIDLFRNRFGDLFQQERYQAQLYARKRKKGESAQLLCFDIRRLLALGFPVKTNKMAEIVGRDCFFNSLDKTQLRIKIFELQPANLDEALNHLCRLKEYESLLSEGGDASVLKERKKVLSVKAKKAVSFAPTTKGQGGNNLIEQKIKQLKIEQVNMRQEIQQVSADAHFWRQRALAAESGGCTPPETQGGKISHRPCSPNSRPSRR